MFAQVVRFRVKPEAWDRLRALDEHWQREQAPVAPGFRGSYILRELGATELILNLGFSPSAGSQEGFLEGLEQLRRSVPERAAAAA